MLGPFLKIFRGNRVLSGGRGKRCDRIGRPSAKNKKSSRKTTNSAKQDNADQITLVTDGREPSADKCCAREGAFIE
jgi:hypothetical protein